MKEYSRNNLMDDIDPTWIKFTCHGPALNLYNSIKNYSKILNEGYFDEIEERLKSLNLLSNVSIQASQVYNEILLGKRYRVVLLGANCNQSSIDKEEIEYILQDVVDDFPELELKINWMN